MPAAETSTKVNNTTSNGAPATMQTLCFSVKCMSMGYDFPNTSREATRTPPKNCVKTVTYKYSRSNGIIFPPTTQNAG